MSHGGKQAVKSTAVTMATKAAAGAVETAATEAAART